MSRTYWNEKCARCGRMYHFHKFYDNRRRCRDGKSFKRAES